MQIKIVPVGMLQANCYILIKNNKCIIIDPGDEKEKIINALCNLKPICIILTHDHFDHIGAVDYLCRHYNIKKYDMSNLEEKEYNFSDFKFEIIYTKGHSKTSLTIYFKEEKVMFTGDFLFKENIGRTDLPGGDEIEMNESINKIKKYQDDIKIYPGHGNTSTLQYEKENNIYFK